MLQADRYVRSGKFEGWLPKFYGTGLTGSVLGIIGMGAVGQKIARMLLGFDMDVLYNDPIVLTEEESDELGITYAPLEYLLQNSDFVVPMVPLTPATKHLINEKTIAQMKRGSFLINTGRGSVVDEQAVASALASGHLSGYAADVFQTEDWARIDRPWEIPRELLDNVEKTFFTPHIGSAVDSLRREIAMEAARSIVQALDGEMPNGALNQP
jgi:phosphonate dehydrogenase